MTNDNVTNLSVGDVRLENACEKLQDEIYILCRGLPFPSVIGVLELIKADLIDQAINGD